MVLSHEGVGKAQVLSDEKLAGMVGCWLRSCGKLTGNHVACSCHGRGHRGAQSLCGRSLRFAIVARPVVAARGGYACEKRVAAADIFEAVPPIGRRAKPVRATAAERTADSGFLACWSGLLSVI